MIIQQLKEMIPLAMKAHDELRVSTLRLLSSAFNYEKIEKQHDLTDEEELVVVAREAKKRRDSIEAYEKGNRNDLADREKQELVILQEFLPPQISDEEISQIVSETVKDLGATNISDFGKVMKASMDKLKGQVDGSKVSQIVKANLSK